LLTGLVIGLGGCGIDWNSVRLDTTPTPTPPTLSPDDVARFAAVATIGALHHQAATVTDPADHGPLLGELTAAHAAHLQQLGPLPGPVPSPSATPTGWPPATTSPPPPLDVAGLAGAEASAAGSLLTGLDKLTPALAQLLCSIACCCLSAAQALAEVSDAPLPPSPAPTPPTDLQGRATPQVADALNALIDADLQAGFGYAGVAAKLTGDQRTLALTRMSAHTSRAQRLQAMASDAGATPTPAPPAYAGALPGDEGAARELAVRFENACAAAASALVGVADGPARIVGVAAVLDTGMAGWQWSSALSAFPGMPDL
jgi:hypothetical protein